MAIRAVEMAREYVDEVEFYAEDAARADREYLFDVISEVLGAGATVINVPDTTGYAVPEQFGKLVRELSENVAGIGMVPISVHCHNDLGMAVSNTLAGVINGAHQVEVTVNGVGERAGNASLEEVVMAMKTRTDYFHVETGVEPRELYKTSQLVSRAFGHHIPPNKPIIGSNAFSHSAGIHVDGFLKDRRTYEIMQPEDVGFPRSRIVLTARSGRHAVKHRLEELGYHLPSSRIDAVYTRFIEVADKVREVPDNALMAIVEGESGSKTYELVELDFSGGISGPSRAHVKIRTKKRTLQGEAEGDGPVDATYKAISETLGKPLNLVDFSISTTGSGTDAVGEATVKVSNHVTAIGHGASTDIVLASARAYIDALNRYIHLEHAANTGLNESVRKR
jgi:2-isopropylmalate synthase